MIVGGLTAGGKTSGVRTGYSSRYLPCKGFVGSAALLAAFSNANKTPIKYSASARIRNLTDTDWVDLPTVTYFQVTRRRGTGNDTANLTVRKPETWGVYGTQAGLLRPSIRALQIIAGITIGTSTLTVPVFYGSITSYSETHGAGGGAINIYLQDIRDRMARTAPTAYTGSQTAYRNALRQALAGVEWFGNDAIFVGDFGVGLRSALNRFDSVLATLAGIPALSVSGYGPLVVGEQITDEATGLSFSYDDSSLITATRALDDAASFNTVTAYGYADESGLVFASQTVTDAADVALRGTVKSPSMVGNAATTLTDAVALAGQTIARSLYGQIRVEMLFNPFLEPGMSIGVSSSRIGIPASRMEIDGMTHQFSVGNARTYINNAPVIPL
jgi:hypothetical protein